MKSSEYAEDDSEDKYDIPRAKQNSILAFEKLNSKEKIAFIQSLFIILEDENFGQAHLYYLTSYLLGMLNDEKREKFIETEVLKLSGKEKSHIMLSLSKDLALSFDTNCKKVNNNQRRFTKPYSKEVRLIILEERLYRKQQKKEKKQLPKKIYDVFPKSTHKSMDVSNMLERGLNTPRHPIRREFIPGTDKYERLKDLLDYELDRYMKYQDKGKEEDK